MAEFHVKGEKRIDEFCVYYNDGLSGDDGLITIFKLRHVRW